MNASQADGATALSWAAHRDDLETAQLLIRAGANVKAANDYGVTPLSLACGNGNAAVTAGTAAAASWTTVQIAHCSWAMPFGACFAGAAGASGAGAQGQHVRTHKPISEPTRVAVEHLHVG